MVVCIESVASAIKPLRKEFFNKFNNVFLNFSMVIIQFFFYSGVSIGNFSEIANFNNIFKFISGSMKGLKFHISDFISYFMFKINFFYHICYSVYALCITHSFYPYSPQTCRNKVQQKPQILNLLMNCFSSNILNFFIFLLWSHLFSFSYFYELFSSLLYSLSE